MKYILIVTADAKSTKNMLRPLTLSKKTKYAENLKMIPKEDVSCNLRERNLKTAEKLLKEGYFFDYIVPSL